MDVNLSFDKIIDKVFAGFKRITPLLVAIDLVSGGMLFLPEYILAKMSLNSLPEIWQRVIGIVFLISFSLSLVIIVFDGVEWIVKKANARKVIRNLRHKYLNLPSTQKKIINQLIHSDNMQIELENTSGNTLYLLNNNFIFQPSQAFSFNCVSVYSNSIMLVYAPQPWLIELYHKEPDLFT